MKIKIKKFDLHPGSARFSLCQKSANGDEIVRKTIAFCYCIHLESIKLLKKAKQFIH